ncbi:type I-C CRISPR-associated protein Cas7/Csd2 [Anaerostipes sp.]|uniref:type I-C CRISPR-associated protein Cas7/Csd2 n=1 Tax=Anaerostipes sp. TaxID=1872530 RepID=UPI002583643F|nr:type I-C CRISPR-associated protein Cas7/Csd2 [Anaerostipes sp.]MCI5622628.1 type I-C CRISPR-associated protein Cas7/Csd2 [Anaerostipes sp.]MDY2725940.1 type I-C CRISPR-associated protein Cas7/Csd2 [Anaerostipes faecalis]
MGVLQNKIDFEAIITVNNANCNGDPLNGNMPRTTYEGYGEISDVCIKRKIRNRLLDEGEKIFVQSDDKNIDGFKSLKARAEANSAFGAELQNGKKADKDKAYEIACKEWMDVRSFGQVFAFKGSTLSLGVRGPVSIHPAFSVDPVDITSIQITKSVNSEGEEGKSSDTMGMKHRVDFGVYRLKGSINVQLAEKTGFTEEDAEKIKEAVRTLFVNDSSSARPDGSMEIYKLYWWKHNCKIGQYSSKKVHDCVEIVKKENVDSPKSIDDYQIVRHDLDGLEVQEYEGL